MSKESALPLLAPECAVARVTHFRNLAGFRAESAGPAGSVKLTSRGIKFDSRANTGMLRCALYDRFE